MRTGEETRCRIQMRTTGRSESVRRCKRRRAARSLCRCYDALTHAALTIQILVVKAKENTADGVQAQIIARLIRGRLEEIARRSCSAKRLATTRHGADSSTPPNNHGRSGRGHGRRYFLQWVTGEELRCR